MSFYNTSFLTGEELKKALSQCKTQEERVFVIFRSLKYAATPSEILAMYCRNGEILVTSEMYKSKQSAIKGIRALVDVIENDPEIVEK